MKAHSCFRPPTNQTCAPLLWLVATAVASPLGYKVIYKHSVVDQPSLSTLQDRVALQLEHPHEGFKHPEAPETTELEAVQNQQRLLIDTSRQNRCASGF